MLRPVLLCLAVGLVFSDYDQGLTPLRFGMYYTVKIEVQDVLRGTVTTLTQWYDELHRKSRVDVFGTTQQFVLQTPVFNSMSTWLMTAVYPITTEQNGTVLNKRACANTIYTSLSYDIPTFLPAVIELPQQFFGITWMVFPTRERMHGEDADKWKKRGWVWQLGDWPNSFVKNHMSEETWWTTYKEIDGVRQLVPLRYEIVDHNLITGSKTNHFRLDYYDYDPSKFDREVFNITKGLVCSPIGIEQAEEQPILSNRQWDVVIQNNEDHSQEYAKEEKHEMRLRVFEKNLKMIEEHNRGEHGYTLAVNHLADRTLEEIAAMSSRASSNTSNNESISEKRVNDFCPATMFYAEHSETLQKEDKERKRFFNSNLFPGHPFPYSKEEIEELSAELPKQLDWRVWGAVSLVKDQLCCDASWAFAAVGAVESGLFLHRKRKYGLVKMSEQALIDCSWGFGNSGCYGGDVRKAFDWIAAHGIPNGGAYGPYLSMEGNCHLKDMKIQTKIKGYVSVESDVKALKVALFKTGPVAATIGVTSKLMFYSGGVFSDPDCPKDIYSITQSVLVIGYGVLDGQSYWLIKNSWGPTWGINGYILMATEDNMCGVLTDANYPFFE